MQNDEMARAHARSRQEALDVTRVGLVDGFNRYIESADFEKLSIALSMPHFKQLDDVESSQARFLWDRRTQYRNYSEHVKPISDQDRDRIERRPWTTANKLCQGMMTRMPSASSNSRLKASHYLSDHFFSQTAKAKGPRSEEVHSPHQHFPSQSKKCQTMDVGDISASKTACEQHQT